MKKHNLFIIMFVALAMILVSCSSNIPNTPNTPVNPGGGEDSTWTTVYHPTLESTYRYVSKSNNGNYYIFTSSTVYVWLNGTSNLFDFDKTNYNCDYCYEHDITFYKSNVLKDVIEDKNTMTRHEYRIISTTATKLFTRIGTDERGEVLYKEATYDEKANDEFYNMLHGYAVVYANSNNNYIEFMACTTDAFNNRSKNSALISLGKLKGYSRVYDVPKDQDDWKNN